MFDADYFNTHFYEQHEELGISRTTIHLHSGISFSVRKFSSAKPGYILIEVYPDGGVTESNKAVRRKPGGTDEVFFDRVAIAYGSISHITLTVTDLDERTQVGFGH